MLKSLGDLKHPYNLGEPFLPGRYQSSFSLRSIFKQTLALGPTRTANQLCPTKPPNLCRACFQLLRNFLGKPKRDIQTVRWRKEQEANIPTCLLCQLFLRLCIIPTKTNVRCAAARFVFLSLMDKDVSKTVKFDGDLRTIRRSEYWNVGLWQKWEPQHETIDNSTVQTLAAHINMEIVKRWVNACLRHVHGEPSPVSIPRLRLIDCETREIVTNLDCPRYLTLSYPWNTNSDDTFDDNVASSLPATIEDAVRLTSILGFRYLWVDRYCINRYDSTDLYTQCQRIWDIFRSSELSVMVDTCASHGIPGWYTSPRPVSLTMPLNERFQLDVTVRSSNLLEEEARRPLISSWTTEAALESKRRLIFRGLQEYFDCPDMAASNVRSQITTQDLIYRAVSFERGTSNIFYLLGEMHHHDKNFELVWGLNNPFFHADQVPTCPECWGIPILDRRQAAELALSFSLTYRRGEELERVPGGAWMSEAFCDSLSWNMDLPVRRQGFPSWSFLGWESQGPGVLMLQLPRRLCNEWGLDVDIKIELRNGEILNLDTYFLMYETIRTRQQLFHFIHIRAWSITLHIHHLSYVGHGYSYQAAIGPPSVEKTINFSSTVYLDPAGEDCEGIRVASRWASTLLVCRRVGDNSLERIATCTLYPVEESSWIPGEEEATTTWYTFQPFFHKKTLRLC
jgi:hypothetical protein